MSDLGDTGKLKMPIKNKPAEAKQKAETTITEESSVETKEEKNTANVRKSMAIGQSSNSKPYEVDLSKPKEKEDNEENEEEVQVDEKQEGKEDDESNEVIEEDDDSESVIELITEEDGKDKEESTEISAEESKTEKIESESKEEPSVELPENIQKLVDFMNQTGGSLEDYVRLSSDYSSIDEKQLLKEYYKQTKSHLDNDDISFKIEEFSYDEEFDDEREIKRKKLQFKEEVSKARKHLEGMKDKYYDEVKLGSKLSPEQKEAVEFYNSHKEQSEAAKESRQDFAQKTEQLFNNDFKGFDFVVGEKKYRHKVNDVASVKETQSDFNNVMGKFFDEKSGKLTDPSGYHKALFAAQNADNLAEHFYNQGKAEGIKEIDAKSKNINMNARKDLSNNITVKGVSVKPVQGVNSTKLRFKSNIKGRRK